MAVCTINRTLLPIKAHYTLFWGGLAGIIPFLLTLLQENGVSATVIGVVYAVLPFVTMISKPVFGGLADRFQLHRSIFLASKFIMTSALFTLYFIPVPSADVVVDDNISRANIDGNTSRIPMNCFDEFQELCPIDINNVSVGGVPDAGSTMTTSYQFVLMCICLSMAWAAMSVAENTGDVIALELLDDQKRGFGNERAWGSMSWGLVAVIAGILIDEASRGKDKTDFTPGFFIMASVGVLDVLVSTRVKVKQTRSKGIAKKVGAVFRRPETIIFTAQVFAVGILTGVLWTFLVVYLNILGASQLLIGLTMASQCLLGEIPFFFIADWFLDRIGHANAITLTLAVFALRFVLYYCVIDPWMVLAIEVSQGINYGLFFTALATYSSLIAPPGTSATVQGIEQAVFQGFGVGIGCLAAGFMFDIVGGARTFLYFGVMAAVSAVLGLLARMWMSVAIRKTEIVKRSGSTRNVCEELQLCVADERVSIPTVVSVSNDTAN